MTSIRYSTTMSESLAAVREGFSPKQIKMAIGIANDPRYKGGNYSGAVKQIEKIKKGLSNHKQVAAVLKRLNTDFDPEIKDDDEEVTESSAARRDAMRHGAGGRRGIDPADRDDVKATDKDKELAKKNMIMQLRKSKDTKGNFSIEFQDGKKQKVDPKFVELLLKAHDMIQKPRDKEQFVQMISKSYRDMLKTAKMVSKQLRMGEEIELDESVMNEKMVMCEQCGKMHEEGACGEMKENKMLGNMDTALASLSKKPEYKKISKNLMSLSKRAAERDKGAPKQLKTQLASLASKVDKKAGAALMKMSKLAGTYESVEIDEMKMDDPKLNKIFDKLKKGQTIKLKTSSTISKGKDFVDYIVKSKNTVNKGRVEKVTLVTKGNEKAVKKFLYKRDGKVTFAIGDMGASIDDIKEELDEGRMKELHGYIEKGMSEQDIAKKMKLDVKTIKSLMDETDLEEAKSSTGYELYHKDFSSAMQHAYAFAKKKFGIEVDPKEIDDKVATGPKKPSNGKTNSYSLKSKDGKKGIQVQVYNTGKNYELNMYKEEVVSEEEEPQKPDSAKEVEQGRDDKKKTRIAQLQLQIAKATETINKLNAQEK